MNKEEKVNHPEWEKQNSLTSPADRTGTQFELNKGIVLDEEQVHIAFKELVVCDVKTYPKIEKFYSDPTIHGQKIALHSFVPAQGCVPDKDGVYGFVKIRGVFSNEREANDHAEKIIRDIDSYHSIYHSFVGKPFPLAFDKKYVAETKEVDLVQKTVETISKDIADKRTKDKKVVEEIKEREKKLIEESKDENRNPVDEYTTLQVKKAQLSWTYVETMKKVEQMKESVLKARREIHTFDSEHPEYKQEYLARYVKARQDAGLPDTDDSFMKYMGEDIDIGF